LAPDEGIFTLIPSVQTKQPALCKKLIAHLSAVAIFRGICTDKNCLNLSVRFETTEFYGSTKYNIMTDSKFKFIFFAILSLGLMFASCNSNPSNSAPTEQTEQAEQATPDMQGKEYASAYICPMHCPGSGSDQPGKCPECGMDYVANDGGESHEGHDH
jgi:hypothetical protein